MALPKSRGRWIAAISARKAKDVAVLFAQGMALMLTLVAVNHVLQIERFKIGIMVGMTVAVAAVIYGYTRYVGHILNKEQVGSRIRAQLLCLLLAVLTYISFFQLPEITHFMDGVVFFVAILWMTAVIDVLQHGWRRLHIPAVENAMHWWDLPVFMIFPLIVSTIALLGVYPGAMSADSIYVWTLVNYDTYTNAQPLLYLLLIKVLTLLWNNPATVSVFQILLVSFTYGYIAYRLKEQGVSRLYCYVLVIVLTVWPTNLMTNLVLWKDIPYTMMMLLFAVEILRMLHSPDYFHSMKNILLINTFALGIMAFRHNGYYVMIFFTIIVVAYWLSKKSHALLLRGGGVLVGVTLFFTAMQPVTIVALGDRYQKQETFTEVAMFAIPVQGFVTIYQDQYERLSVDQKARIEQYLNLDGVNRHVEQYDNQLWRYYARSRDTANAQTISEDRMGVLRLYLELFSQYPREIIGAYMNSTGIAWSSREMGYTSTYALNIVHAEDPYYLRLDQNIQSQRIRSFLQRMGMTAYIAPTNAAFWRPALMLLILIFLIIASKLRMKTLLIALVPIANHLSYFASCEGQCTRYMYVNYSIVFLLIVYGLLNNAKINRMSQPKGLE